jgi:hypothetical protein
MYPLESFNMYYVYNQFSVFALELYELIILKLHTVKYCYMMPESWNSGARADVHC